MSDVPTWSPTAGGNNTASPDGFPENMPPSGLNDSSREVMAAVRRAFESLGFLSSGGTSFTGIKVNVQAYGAVGDGVTDDTTAIRAAYAAANALRVAGNSTGGIWGGSTQFSGSAPALYFPYGVYKITGYITDDTGGEVNYLRIIGDKAAIVASSGVTVFGGVAYHVAFTGLTFRDGACAISLKTQNVDKVMILIDDCEFHEHTDACIRTDSTSNSTNLTINRSLFVNISGGGQIVKQLTADNAVMHECWIKCNSDKAFTVGETGAPSTPAKLIIRDCIGVPGGTLVGATGRWADVYGELHCDRFRFGGELGGGCPLRFYGDGVGGISLSNSSAFSNDNVIEFYGLPSFIHIDSMNGFTDVDGLYFDTTITNEQFRVFQEDADVHFSNITPEGFGGLFFMNSAGFNAQTKMGLLIIMAKLYNKNMLQYLGACNRLTESQVLGSFERQGTGWALSTGSITSSAADDVYGVNQRVLTATGDDASYTYNNNTILDPTALTAEAAYTLVVVLDSTIAGNSMHVVEITVGGMARQIAITGGRQVVAIPFVYLNDTGSADTNMDRIVFAGREIANGSAIKIGRMLILDGFVNWQEEVCILQGTGADPGSFTSISSQTDSYFRGDIKYHNDVAASGHIGRVCTTEGDPGTWKTYGSVSA